MKKTVLLVLGFLFMTYNAFPQYLDTVFQIPVSVKFQTPAPLAKSGIKKLAVDYNGIPYLLAEEGLFRVYNNQIVKDEFYLSLADKQPIDITIQDSTGYLFYLYDSLYLSNAHAGKIYAYLPQAYAHIRVGRDYKILVYKDDAGAIFHDNQISKEITMPSNLIEVYAHEADFYALTASGIFLLRGNSWDPFYEKTGIQTLCFREQTIGIGTSNGILELDYQANLAVPLRDELPVTNVKKLAWEDGQLWAITDQGAFSKDADGFRYYASKRWLDNDTLIDMGFGDQGEIYLLSKTGLNKIECKEMTLADKATFFENKIRKNHLRYGFVSSLRHPKQAPSSSPFVHDHDNDGLWTSFYLSSQALRYVVTQEERARRYAWESFEAFERLISVNPLKGFPSRTFERTGYKVADVERWRNNSPDKGWEWKGTTSSDEFVAYILVAAMMDEFIAKGKAEKQRVAAFIDAILMHIIENDYYFIDNDGQPTTWGRWHPDFVNSYPETVYDRKLNSTLLIAGFQLGYTLTKKEIYRKQLEKVIRDFGYLENMMRPMGNMRPTLHLYGKYEMGLEWNHSDDEMAFLTYWVLDRYALNEEMKKKIEWVIQDHWEIEKPERNALWNLITYASTGEIDLASTIWHLKEFPLDLMGHRIKNSHRKDLTFLGLNFRGQTTTILLPPGEQPMHRHNSNPFRLDGGNGRDQLAGDEYLFPYWLGRYLKVIE